MYLIVYEEIGKNIKNILKTTDKQTNIINMSLYQFFSRRLFGHEVYHEV